MADPQATDYVFGGAGTSDTMRANEEAFRRWRIVPRMLRDVSARDLSTTVLGTECPAPLGLAPIGAQAIVHADSERGSARAAAAVGLPMAVSAVGEFVSVFTNPRLTWEDLEFLRSRTTLPIALKGILHPEDARAAREHGIDAVVVSNHGGRQVDGAIASLDALPAIVDAVGEDMDVLLDSGVRSGADVVKALALGADAVLLGRPFIWGLAVGGEAGVLAVLRALLAELDLTIGLSGHTGPGQLHPGILVREGARG